MATQVAQTGNVVTTSAENVSVDGIVRAIDSLARPKDKDEGILPKKPNGIMSFKEILDLGFSPCEIHSLIACWPTPGGQVRVRESIERKCKDLEIC
jgi:hypothetical protein